MQVEIFLFQNGDTHLHNAARNGSRDIVQLLLERTDIDPNKGNQVKNKVQTGLLTI